MLKQEIKFEKRFFLSYDSIVLLLGVYSFIVVFDCGLCVLCLKRICVVAFIKKNVSGKVDVMLNIGAKRRL
jgi:hypothetical protein